MVRLRARGHLPKQADVVRDLCLSLLDLEHFIDIIFIFVLRFAWAVIGLRIELRRIDLRRCLIIGRAEHILDQQLLDA